MNEYISRDKAINAIKSLESSMPTKDNYAKGYDAALGRALIAVRTAPPSADVQPVKRGRWELTDNSSFKKCSECGAWWSSDIADNCFTNYCPKCGARMDGDKNE